MQNDENQQYTQDDQNMTFGDQQSFMPATPPPDMVAGDTPMPALPPMPNNDASSIPSTNPNDNSTTFTQDANLSDISMPVFDNHIAGTNDSPSLGAMPSVSSGLDDIKNDALHDLSPLLGYLEQSPEEKFRTTMMLIQASDDQSLIKQAYESATQITDQKLRAEALLDLINEINYFEQNQSQTNTN